jgi:hypothetical protein
MKNFENRLLPISHSLYNKKIDQHFSLAKILSLISSDSSLNLKIRTLRQTNNLQKKKQLKNLLPLFFPAIELPDYKRIDDNQKIKSTGLIHFDIDIYNQAQTQFIFEQLIEKIPYLVYAFRSPRKGLKFSIASDFLTDSKETIRLHYTLIYRSVQDLLQSSISTLAFDNANERISQSCFFSYDPELYVNYKPDIFLTRDIINEASRQLQITYTKKPLEDNTDKEKQQALKALSFIPSNLNYHERFKINLAITSIFGTEALSILSKHWQHENSRKLLNDIQTQVTYAMTHPIMISAGTLFYYAKQYGFSF